MTPEGDHPMNFEAWQDATMKGDLPSRAWDAEAAWTAAVEEMRRVIQAAYPTESTSAGLAMMLDSELDGMLP